MRVHGGAVVAATGLGLALALLVADPAAGLPARTASASTPTGGGRPVQQLPCVRVWVDISVLGLRLQAFVTVGCTTTTTTTLPPTTTTLPPTSTTTTTTTLPPTTLPTTTTTTTIPPTTTTTTTTTVPPTTTTVPPTTTLPPTTTTTTTTVPPTTTTVPPTTTLPPTTLPTTTTTTTTTTVPPSPPHRLTVSATVDPRQPVAGEPATVRIVVRNEGERAAESLELSDAVSRAATIRNATSPGGRCRTTSRQADCQLGQLAPGDVVTTEVRLLAEPTSASRTVTQRITLSADGETRVADRSISALLAGSAPGEELLDLPGTTVTVIAFFGFVLAARSSARMRGSR